MYVTLSLLSRLEATNALVAAAGDLTRVVLSSSASVSVEGIKLLKSMGQTANSGVSEQVAFTITALDQSRCSYILRSVVRAAR